MSANQQVVSDNDIVIEMIDMEADETCERILQEGIENSSLIESGHNYSLLFEPDSDTRQDKEVTNLKRVKLKQEDDANKIRKENEQKRIRLRFVEDTLNVEEFICEVEKFPCLWDSGEEAYTDKLEKHNAWLDVISSTISNFDDLTKYTQDEIVQIVMRKWKHIRGSFARELRLRKKEQKFGPSAKRRKPYVYFEQLRFLENSIQKPQKSSKSQTDSSEIVLRIEEEANETSEGDEQVVQRSSNQKRIKRKISNEDGELMEVKKMQVINNEKFERKNDEIDGDKLFLLSLLPEMKLIPQHRKLKTRSDILTVIANAQTPA